MAVEAVDFRKGIDSLAQLCRDKLAQDPFSGCVFIFRCRRATSIKVLVYDGMGEGTELLVLRKDGVYLLGSQVRQK